jgi:hypothetical protein
MSKNPVILYSECVNGVITMVWPCITIAGNTDSEKGIRVTSGMMPGMRL